MNLNLGVVVRIRRHGDEFWMLCVECMGCEDQTCKDAGVLVRFYESLGFEVAVDPVALSVN